jgi:hypothetical protein
MDALAVVFCAFERSIHLPRSGASPTALKVTAALTSALDLVLQAAQRRSSVLCRCRHARAKALSP